MLYNIDINFIEFFTATLTYFCELPVENHCSMRYSAHTIFHTFCVALDELLDARVHFIRIRLLAQKKKIIAPFLYFACLQLNVNYMYSLNLPFAPLFAGWKFLLCDFYCASHILCEHNSVCWFQLIPAKMLFPYF